MCSRKEVVSYDYSQIRLAMNGCLTKFTNSYFLPFIRFIRKSRKAPNFLYHKKTQESFGFMGSAFSVFIFSKFGVLFSVFILKFNFRFFSVDIYTHKILPVLFGEYERITIENRTTCHLHKPYLCSFPESYGSGKSKVSSLQKSAISSAITLMVVNRCERPKSESARQSKGGINLITERLQNAACNFFYLICLFLCNSLHLLQKLISLLQSAFSAATRAAPKALRLFPPLLINCSFFLNFELLETTVNRSERDFPRPASSTPYRYNPAWIVNVGEARFHYLQTTVYVVFLVLYFVKLYIVLINDCFATIFLMDRFIVCPIGYAIVHCILYLYSLFKAVSLPMEDFTLHVVSHMFPGREKKSYFASRYISFLSLQTNINMKTLVVLLGLLAVGWARYENEMRLANNRFTVELLRSLPSSPEKNIFFSPYSISTAIGMVFAGAKGDTQKDLYDGFGYLRSGLKLESVLEAYADHARQLQLGQSQSTLDVANAAAIHERLALLSAYESALDATFHAQLLKVDFVNGGAAAVDEINSWVNQKTHGKIEKLFSSPLDESTRLVLLNAIFFKGAWKTKFDEGSTSKEQFLNGGTTPTQVDTMTKTIEIGYKSFPSLGLDVAELPYAGGNYSMVILLPKANDGVEVLKHNLTEHLLQDFIGHTQPNVVAVSLPKFKMELEYSLKDHLKTLGINKIFNADADLSGITSDEGLVVSDVVHKAVVDVNEEGTEAAAASGVVVVNRFVVEPRLELKVDHPFLFFIRNIQTKDLLFAGQVNHL
ncbi:unnamed protein product [Ixodes hexagonus]